MQLILAIILTISMAAGIWFSSPVEQDHNAHQAYYGYGYGYHGGYSLWESS